jgi:uncharacterized damage-inducible protein DinB
MNALALIHRLREHQAWANARLVETARKLTPAQLTQQFPIGQGSVLATLAHLYAAEFVWLEAMQGNPSPISPFDVRFDSLAELVDAWQQLDRRWERFHAQLTDADLQRPVAKASALEPGKTYSTPLYDVLLHLSTHAQYTVAQLRNMLRHLRISPLPDVMLITLSREQSRR